MLLARLVVTAVKVEGRSKSAVARDFGVSRRWVHTLGLRLTYYPGMEAVLVESATSTGVRTVCVRGPT